MNIYLLVFIIIIPITIFLFTVINDRQFKIRMHNFKNDLMDISTGQVLTKNVLTIDNGIGFGFGKEFFQCKESGKVKLTDKQKCDQQGKDIGIKFHKFNMNKNFNIPEIDNVVLNDYCSDEFLKANFIDILNNIWNQSGLKFYLNDVIKEDEVNNLILYYNYSPEDETIFPNCKDILEYQQNPIKFNGFFDEENNTIQEPVSSTSAAVDTVFDRYSLRPPPNMEPIKKPPLPENYGKINDTEKKQMVENDIYIIKRLLGKNGILNDEESKRVIRNIFFRMTDESQYLNDKDLHIYLVPFIKDDIAFIVEGRNKRPLLVISMYHLKCNKLERVIEKVSTDRTCGYWITKLISNYNQLRSYENDYNKIAKIDIKQNKNNKCAAGIIGPAPTIHTNLDNFMEDERTILQKIKKFKEENNHIEELKKMREVNVNKMKNIYEYDYYNDHRVKQLKKFKGRSGPMTFVEDGIKTEKIVGYNTMVTHVIDDIQKQHKNDLINLQKKVNIHTQKINDYNKKLKELEAPLNNLKNNIENILEPHKGTRNTEILIKLKESISKVREQISVPMLYAEKIRPILNINLLIAQMFDLNVNKSIFSKNLEKYNSDDVICEVLSKPFNKGGTIISTSLKNTIRKNRANESFLKLNTGLSGLRHIILGPYYKNTLFSNEECDKCSIYVAGSNKNELCEKSKFYETAQLNSLDLNAQYYLVNMILKDIHDGKIIVEKDKLQNLEDFKKELEYKCLDCQGEDLTNYRVEPNFLKNSAYYDENTNKKNEGFFTNTEAIKNYEWLSKFIFENQLTINDQFIFEGAEYLSENSNIFNENLKNQFFQPEIVIEDAIPCDIPEISPILEVDNTLLNDYILKKQNCNSNYLNKQTDSFL